MNLSDTGLKLIEKFEGCKLTAYKDSVGVWTIGYGHTSGVKEGDTCTQAQAEAYLKEDAAKAEAAVNKYQSVYNFNQNQYDALVSFAFNIGNINQLTANGSRTIAQISAKIPEYNKAGGKVLSGLVSRRAAEKELFDFPVALNDTTNQNEENASGSSEEEKVSETKMPTLKNGSSGKAVKLWQIIIGVTADGSFGAKTLAATKTFQKNHGLTVDGIVGNKSWKAGLESVE